MDTCLNGYRLAWAAITLLVCFHGAAFACQPCVTLSVDESLRLADAVVVGRRVLGAGDTNPRPEWIEVEVSRVLKGGRVPRRIKVKSWSGMCPYGVVIGDDKPYVMLLGKRGRKAGVYGAVDKRDTFLRCAVRALPVEGDAVNIDGSRRTLEELQKQIGSADDSNAGRPARAGCATPRSGNLYRTPHALRSEGRRRLTAMSAEEIPRLPLGVRLA